QLGPGRVGLRPALRVRRPTTNGTRTGVGPACRGPPSARWSRGPAHATGGRQPPGWSADPRGTAPSWRPPSGDRPAGAGRGTARRTATSVGVAQTGLADAAGRRPTRRRFNYGWGRGGPRFRPRARRP